MAQIKQETRLRTILPVLALLLPTATSTTLLGLHLSKWNFGNNLRAFISGNPDWVTGSIQILSTIFTTLQVYAILSTVNFATRIKLTKSETSLDTLDLWVTIC